MNISIVWGPSLTNAGTTPCVRQRKERREEGREEDEREGGRKRKGGRGERQKRGKVKKV